MPIMSTGDMAQNFISMRQTSTIKSALADLSESLSTGQVTDVAEALDGETTRLSGINHSLSQIEGYLQNNREAEQTLSGMQNVLAQVDQLRGNAAADLLLLNEASTARQVGSAATAARAVFEDLVSALNRMMADRALMAGIAVDQAPLADADVMLADIQTMLGGVTDPATINAAISTWFDDPAGGFATIGYLGDTGAPAIKRLSDSKTVTIDARADSDAIRDVLKAAAAAAMAEGLPTLDRGEQAALLRVAGENLFASASGLAGLQADLGYVEADVQQEMTRLTAEKTALSLSKNNLIQADPFETASRLQQVQLQLETHFSVTARLSRLTLLDYIR